VPTRAETLERLAVLDGLCDLFTDEYAAVAPLSRERVALYETLDLLTNVVHCWIKVRPERLAGSMIALEKHVADNIGQLGG
jgi:hypothetical protein